MRPLIRSLPVVLGIFLTTLCFADTFERDTIPTSAGDLEITFIGHGTLMMRFAGKVIHIDPYSSLADYGQLPKADIILLTSTGCTFSSDLRNIIQDIYAIL
ncbi:MAG: hypothetical protein R6W99_02515 [Clostridia bacterium]